MGNRYVYNKKRRRSSTVPLLVVFLVLGAASAVFILRSHNGHDNTLQASQTNQVVLKPVATALVKSATNYGLPVRLQIAKMRVDAKVTYMGITKEGNMSVPPNVVDAGWYKYSNLPGATGTAVVAGHLDGLRGEPGVFSSLSSLTAGDKVTIIDSNNKPIVFVVRELKTYDQNEQPKEVFTSTSGSHLNLITCAGSWNSTDHRFAKRLVVFTDKVSLL